MIQRNRYNVIKNCAQGQYKKVLCLCSAGCLRSPTAAVVLAAEPFNFNTRSAGLDSYAITQVDEGLLLWADEIVVMEPYQEKQVQGMLDEYGYERSIVVLKIEDMYYYRSPDLMEAIARNYEAS